MARDPRKNSERKKGLGPSGLEASLHLLATLHAQGVREVVLCPGGRNAPMIQALEMSGKKFKVMSFFDERAAGFFALGLARQHQRAVLVSVTSGTALAELLPSVIEAEATRVPLIIHSADRPRSHRGIGSPQSMEQVGIFGRFAQTLIDWQEGEKYPDWLKKWKGIKPVHLNLCHQEPLWSKETTKAPVVKIIKTKKLAPQIKARLPQFKNPLLLVGSLELSEVKSVERFIKWLGADTLCEASSQLSSLSLSDKQIKLSDYDGVIRLGGVPSFRLWRDLEFNKLPTVSFGESDWVGTPHGKLFSGELKSFLERWMKTGEKIKAKPKQRLLALELFEKYPQSEPALIHQISKKFEKESLVYLGNSRPIRDWNSFAEPRKDLFIQDTRGLNGIDGQISTFYGLARPGMNYALLGDLTTLYDMQGPWALRYLNPQIKTRLIVINNSGGQIFKTMFPTSLFRNEHNQSFKSLAEFWNIPYATTLEIEADHALIELTPNAEQTAAFRRDWERLS